MENNVLDEFTRFVFSSIPQRHTADLTDRFPPLVSAFPDEDIDELASSDDEHKGGSALTKDLNRLGTSMNMSDWNMGQFEPSLEDSSQSKKGLLSDSRIESTSLPSSSLHHLISSFPQSLSSHRSFKPLSHSQPHYPNSLSTPHQSGPSNDPLDFERSRSSWIGNLYELR